VNAFGGNLGAKKKRSVRVQFQITPADIMRRELTIKGSFAQIDCFPRALDYLESGKIKVNEIVTHEIPLKDYQTALNLPFAREGIKIAIIP